MSEATLLRTGHRPVLRFQRHLPGSIDAVWRAVTDPIEMRAWFPTRIDIDEWRVGATLTHHFDGHDIDPLPGKVLEWDPPHRVSFTWGDDTIGFDLTAAPDGGTTFVLTEELSANHAARNAAGWESCLDRLEHGVEREEWKARFDHYVEAFAPTLGRQDGPPEGHRDPTE
ncbi:MAG TPA: SRPBCC domain-containing protein [Mycobacteriales bacterium]|nr:SRPBCC domain-containing protein [Mycobacteriales bacterium]